MKGGGSQRTSEDSRGQGSDGRAVEARDDLNDSANRPTAAHGKLEKPEQQVIFGRKSETERSQEVKGYGLINIKGG